MFSFFKETDVIRITVDKQILFVGVFMVISMFWLLYEVSLMDSSDGNMMIHPKNFLTHSSPVNRLNYKGILFRQFGISLSTIIEGKKNLSRIQKQLAKNHTECDFASDLRHILLAINFNFPHYSSVPLLKKFYGTVFGKIVFCGEQENKELGVWKINENRGYQGYVCVARAIREFPHFTGYMHSNDDVIINWWNLNHHDYDKVWTGTPILFDKGHIFHEEPPAWHWWRDVDAAVLCEKAFHDLEALTTQTHEGGQVSMERYFQQYYANTGNKRICLADWSDLFYIPNQFSKTFVKFSEVFSSNKVFLEVAVPMILSFFINSTNYVILEGVNLADYYGDTKKYKNGVAFYEMYNSNLDFIHPFKLESDHRYINKIFFQNFVMSYGNIVLNKCLVATTNKNQNISGGKV